MNQWVSSGSFHGVKTAMRDMGTPGSPPTRVSAVPDRRARPTRRPADLSVDPPDLTCGPKNMKILGVQDKTVQTV
jgi:hypothetical protein